MSRRGANGRVEAATERPSRLEVGRDTSRQSNRVARVPTKDSSEVEKRQQPLEVAAQRQHVGVACETGNNWCGGGHLMVAVGEAGKTTWRSLPAVRMMRLARVVGGVATSSRTAFSCCSN